MVCNYDISTLMTGDVTDESDNCTSILDASYIDNYTNLTSCDTAGFIIRKWILSDDCGNTNEKNQVIWIEPTAKVNLTTSNRDTICTNLFTSVTLHSITNPTVGVRFRYTIIPDSPSDISFTYATDTFDLVKDFVIRDSIINKSPIPQGITLWVEPYNIDGAGNAKCPGIPQSIYLQITPRLVMQDSAKTFVKGYNLRCHNDGSGTIYMYPYGGIAAYSKYGLSDLTYHLNGSPVTDTIIESLSAGIYNLEVADFSGCYAQKTDTLIEPDTLSYTFVMKDTALCVGETGVYYITPDGGTYFDVAGKKEGYTVTWIKAGTYPGFLPFVGDTINQVAFGFFLYEIRDSNNCWIQGEKQINQSDIHKFEVFAPDTNYGGYDIRCFGDSNGRLHATMSPYWENYDYYLLDPDDTLTAYTCLDCPADKYFDGLAAGRYIAHAYNKNNCLAEADTVLIEPEVLQIADTSVKIYNDYFNVSCYCAEDGEIRIEDVEGGRGSYNYVWKRGTTLLGETSSVLSNIHAGNYRSIVNDGYCYDSLDFTLVTPPDITLDVLSANDIMCNGDSTGSIQVTSTGGIGPHTYSWNYPGISGPLVVGLPAGTYIYTVTDSILCSRTDTVILAEPAVIEITPQLSDFNGYEIQCFDGNNGKIEISTSGGTGNHIYLWRDSEGLQISTDTIVQNLESGTYYLTVTDENTCEKTEDYQLDEPDKLAINATIHNMTCAILGEIIAEPGGGVPFNYGYNLLWSDGSEEYTLDSLVEGYYYVTISDMNGCSVVDTAYIEEENPMLAIINVLDSISCAGYNDGKLGVDIEAGTPPISYIWDGELGSAEYSNIAAGEHTVEVTDKNLCKVRDTVNLTEPSPIAAELIVNNAHCYDSADASISLGAHGGNGGYIYYWNNNYIAGSLVDNQKAGVYILTIIDQKFCRLDSTIGILQPEELIIEVHDEDVIRPVCPATEDGSIRVRVVGGTTPYNYQWIGEDISEDVITNLAAGEYTMKVVDSYGCTTEKVIHLDNQLPACLNIISAFTPNNDSYNDVWEITHPTDETLDISSIYPHLIIEVFSRTGQKVYVSPEGYPRSESWQGTDNNGNKLPVDSYYYIVHVNDGSGITMQGIVTIIR
jgi:gliding motility-associated-like protein